MGNFLKDLEESKVAVKVVEAYLKREFEESEVRILNRDEQIKGDVEVSAPYLKPLFVEIKYDIMAKKTGNLCFETHNGKGDPTGISTTQADEVFYVVPKEEGFTIFMFETNNLRKYIFDPVNISKVKVVYGGDKKKFSMILVPIETLVKDRVHFQMEEVSG